MWKPPLPKTKYSSQRGRNQNILRWVKIPSVGKRREGKRGGRRKLRVTLEVSSGKDGGVSGRPIPSLFGEGGGGKSQSVFGGAWSPPAVLGGRGTPQSLFGGARSPPSHRGEGEATPARAPGAGGGGEAGRDRLSCEAGPLKIKGGGEIPNKTGERKKKKKRRGGRGGGI